MTDADWRRALRHAQLSGRTAPRELFEAPYLGNGALGAYLTVEANRLVFWVDHNRHRDHQRQGGALWGRSRLPVGRFEAGLPWPIQRCEWRLDVAEALLSVTVFGAGTQVVSIDAFVSADDGDALLIHQHAGSPLPWSFVPAEPVPPRQAFEPHERPVGLLPHAPATVRRAPGGLSTSIQNLAAGGGVAVAWRVEGRHTVLAVAVAAAHASGDAVAHAAGRLVHDALADTTGWRRRHGDWWARYYRASYLDVPDRLSDFFWVQLYKLASATRRDAPVLTTMGPWLAPTPWAGAWWNLNVQLSYPLAARTGHHDLDSLTPALLAHAEQLQRNAGTAGRAAIGRASQDDLDAPCPPPGTPTTEAGNLLWALHTAIELRETAADDQVVDSALVPLVEQAVEHYLDVLVEDVDGVLHIPLTHSPEFDDVTDANYDLALLTWGLALLVSRSSRATARWHDVLSRLAPAPVDPVEGLLIGADRHLDVSHRHYSHLLWFEPLRVCDADEPRQGALLRASLDHWLSMPAALRGYSRTGAASMAAQLLDGDAAIEQLDLLLDSGVSPTTMYRETGPVLETPLAAARSTLDLLLDEPAGRVRVFPAVPARWRDARFHDLRVRGGHRVSAQRREGRTVCISVVAGSDATLVIDTDLHQLHDIDGVTVTSGPRGVVVRAPMRRGDVLHLVAPEHRTASAGVDPEHVQARRDGGRPAGQGE